MVDPSHRRLVLIDFGFAKTTYPVSGSADEGIRMRGAYSSPEVATLGTSSSRKRDIWSIGCILLEHLLYLEYGNDTAIKIFGRDREGGQMISIRRFYMVDLERNPVLHPAVTTVLSELARSKQPQIRDIAKLTRGENGLLSIKADKRPSARETAERLRRISDGLTGVNSSLQAGVPKDSSAICANPSNRDPDSGPSRMKEAEDPLQGSTLDIQIPDKRTLEGYQNARLTYFRTMKELNTQERRARARALWINIQNSQWSSKGSTLSRIILAYSYPVAMEGILSSIVARIISGIEKKEDLEVIAIHHFCGRADRDVLSLCRNLWNQLQSIRARSAFPVYPTGSQGKKDPRTVMKYIVETAAQIPRPMQLVILIDKADLCEENENAAVWRTTEVVNTLVEAIGRFQREDCCVRIKMFLTVSSQRFADMVRSHWRLSDATLLYNRLLEDDGPHDVSSGY
jgi:hypothetical protein